MNANTRYEIKARAFNLMTGHMAPGKDSPAAAGPTDYDERELAWLRWLDTNRHCIESMFQAFEEITEDDPGP